MASEWGSERFARMAVLVRDTVHPSDAPRLPYIGLEHIGEGTLQLLGTGIAEDATSLKARFRSGDILFGKLRPYFRKVIRAPFDGICSTDIWVVRPQPGVDAGFLFYLMASNPFLEPVVRASEGTKMPRAKWEYAASLELPFPPLPKQRAIAHILGTLDDKIELNRRMSETLEAMARALFKSWFIDFDPVRAKVEGRDPGLPEPVAALFPDRFKDSEMGEVPEGWRSSTLADFAQLNPESWSRANRPETLRYVDLSNAKWGHIDAIASHRAESAPSRAQRVLGTGDTIVGTVRPGNGSYAFVSEEGLTGSTGFAVLRAKRNDFAAFVYLAATDRENVEALAHLADGAAYPAVRPEVVLSTPVVGASDHVLTRFSMLVGPMLWRIAASDAESRNLADLRDALLPKLISGEIRVHQAERLLEAAPA